MVREGAIAPQIARADLILAQFLHHSVVEDGLLFLPQDSVLESELAFVLSH